MKESKLCDIKERKTGVFSLGWDS